MDKIENLNLVALRKYACAKVNGQKEWFLKCVECPQLKDCKVGQRAHDILESETTPAKLSPAERFQEAAKHPEPAKWLFENGYYDKQWRANDAWKQYLCRTTGKEPPKPENSRTNNGLLLREMARTRIKNILADNPDEKELFLRILEKKPDLTASSVNSRLYQWARDYPDIIEGYPQVNSLCRMINTFAKHKKSAKEAYDSLFGPDAKPEEDEVSIEDFLKETTAEPEPVAEEPKSEPDPEKPSGDISPSPEQLVLQKEFTRKRVDLKFRLAHIQQAFEALDKERIDILSKLEALDKTAELFGMRPIRKEESLNE